MKLRCLFRLAAALGFLLGAVALGAQPEAEPTGPGERDHDANGAPAAYVIPIKGEIDRALHTFVTRGVQEAEARGAGTIVFEIDTFGGRVDSALQIATQIGAVEGIETIAYVPSVPAGTGVSWSAGALIAFSCSRIYMAPGTSMGAAAPVYQTGEGTEMAPEKVVSAVRAQMAALAEKNGYPKAVALAMVDMDVELLEVYLDGELTVAAATDLPDLERTARQEGKTLEKGRVISPAGKLLTLTAGEMETYGVSAGTVSGLDALLELLGVSPGEVSELAPSGPDKLVALITGGAVTSILVLIGLVALYLEITSPGFGVPGTVAIIAFAIVFLGGALLGTVGSLEIILFILGVILLVVEIFLIPGFGAVGISGIVLMVLSLVLSRQQFLVPRYDWQWDIFLKNLRNIGLAFLGSLVLAAVLFRSFRKVPVFRRLILDSAQEASEGYTAQAEEITGGLLGRKGTATTPLRPAGKAEFDGEVLVVETDGEYLETGTAVEVIEVSGNRILVRRA
ncbi:MAG: nodulation protein NfeD [Spirochaetales bacterium]|nr:nodulation protein NfeD [Spirochaetales bacterium]